MTASDPPGWWFDRHPYLTLALVLGGAALLLWFLFFRKGGDMPSAPARALVSAWTPLQ